VDVIGGLLLRVDNDFSFALIRFGVRKHCDFKTACNLVISVKMISE
jgi:hypothetical protein